ncbi:hypothetical protein HAHI6034_05645 [Hathewaya histolytica]|uniref:Uncharacterized protein n=1 Tax=Hathewaya histolytica TaxID=1498 RepID=A0A4U9RDX2_HATHI|nr:hypothetical protein [Hathewaya histolytica]VTQ89859.1 Uncharacterised protein [Hathewaya histolytica]
MAKRDNVYMVLMTHCKVNLQCDTEKLQLRYGAVKGKEYGEWFINGENTGLQVTRLYEMLKEKYKNIRVIWKRQF